MSSTEESDLPRERLLAALKNYLDAPRSQGGLAIGDERAAGDLVNALAMLCPFEPAEKQALLEAPGWNERVATLVALLEMSDAHAVSRAIN